MLMAVVVLMLLLFVTPELIREPLAVSLLSLLETSHSFIDLSEFCSQFKFFVSKSKN
jgi:hypothetical protein